MKTKKFTRRLVLVVGFAMFAGPEVMAQSSSATYGMPTVATTDAFAGFSESGAYRSFVRQGVLSGPSSSLGSGYSIFFGFLNHIFDFEVPPERIALETLSTRSDGAEISVQILGAPGELIQVDRSSNLNEWAPFDTPTLLESPQEFRFPIGSDRVFYRFRYSDSEN